MFLLTLSCVIALIFVILFTLTKKVNFLYEVINSSVTRDEVIRLIRIYASGKK